MLHGREADCAAVSGLIDAARVSRSGVEVVRGEPGVGKTALLAYAADQARGLPLLRGTGVESEVNLPFAALHQLLYPVLGRLPALPAPQAAALGGAFGITPGRSDDPFLVAVAVLTLLADVAGETGLVCLVDDAQWLDQSSADVLVFTARRLNAEGIVLLFAARDGEQHAFAAPGLPERRLAGLDPRSAAALLDEAAPGLDRQVRTHLVEHTAGNPLALLELPALLNPGQRAGAEPLPEPLPVGRTLQRIFAERVRRLPAATQRLLLVVAAEETGNLTTVLRATADAGDGLDALDAAERSGLIGVHDGRVRFRHPLVRSAVYQGATFSARRDAHRALAGILQGADDADRRAWHRAAAAVDHDDDVAASLEESADRARVRGGVAAAADALARAAELTSSDAERGRRLLAAAQDAWLAGRRDRAADLLAAADAIPLGVAQQALAKQLGGLIELRRGVPERAYRLLVDGAAPVLDRDPHTALETLVLAGEAASVIGDPALVGEVGRLALQATPGTSPDDVLMARMLGGMAVALTGDSAGGTAMLRDVVAGARSFREPAKLLWAARAAWYLGDLDVALSLLTRGADNARASGAIGMLSSMLDRVASMQAVAGRAAEAEAAADEGLELAGEFGLDAGNALSSLALVGAIRGDEEACRSAAARAHALAEARRLRIVEAAADWALGLLELGLGRPGQAFDKLITLAAPAGHPGILLWAVPDLVEAAARSGRPEDCRAVLERFARWVTAGGLAVPAAALSRCRGLLAEGDAAIEHFTAALGHDRRAGRPLERARSELSLGEALRRRRRRTEARKHLRDALATFELIGAAPWAERARTELRASGESARRRDPSTVQTLTPQEMQIARFAGAGDSNSDIAAKLFLSRRTVEYHLRKAYIKLDITSRADLAKVGLGRL
jgi:DNA-binding CsgD family transcriptional regulator